MVATTLAAQALSARTIRDLEDLQETYDYVIVGGELSGLFVAARLGEDPGGQYQYPWAHQSALTDWNCPH